MKVSVLLASCVAALALLVSPAEARAAHRSSSPSLAALSEAQRQAAFVDFVKTYGKSYPADEFFSRYNVFSEHLATITKHNEEAAQGKHSWTMAVNSFSDLTTAEFKKQRTGYKPFKSFQEQPTLESFQPAWRAANLTDPDFVDLRQSGQVTNVKDQQQCGSCWSFAAAASIESARKKAHNVLFSMSEQQMIDCCPQSLGCNGCNGGAIEGAYQWVINNGGITNIENYPYTAQQGQCRSVSNDVSFTAYQRLPQDEGAMAGAVANVGTVSVAINTPDSFQHYSAGIYSGSDCNQDTLDHAVALIGYGYDQPSGKNFFIVKNSWGTGWGVGGYIYMQRGINLCGINKDAAYMSP